MPPIAMFAGGVLMATSALVAMVIWITMPPSEVFLPQPPPRTLAASLADSTSLEGVKQVCASVAQIYDTQAMLIRTQGEHISQLLRFLLWGIVGVGFTLGPVFLFIYFATRKHVLRTSA